MTPGWRQFAAIPFDATVAAVVRALAVEVPPEGRPRSFRAEGFLAAITTDGAWLICRAGLAQPVTGPREVLRAAQLPAGTPSGDALRLWLGWWGWVPKGRAAPEPQEQTRQIS